MGKDAPLHSNKSRTSEPMTAETNNKESNSSRANSSKTNNQTSTSSTGSSSESSSHGASDSKTFEFVLVTDAQSRRQVRRHAMRQYMRQRRQDDIARLEPSRVSTGGWSKAAEHSRPLKVQEIGDGDAAVERDACSSGDSLVKPEGNDFGGFRTLTALEKFSFSDPMATPSSSAIYDPFNSYPISMKPADHSLIHHCEYSPLNFHLDCLLYTPEISVSQCPLPCSTSIFKNISCVDILIFRKLSSRTLS